MCAHFTKFKRCVSNYVCFGELTSKLNSLTSLSLSEMRDFFI